MPVAFDTSVLADLRLKTNQESGEKAHHFLQQSVDPVLPHYAIKELKSGPLYYWQFLHNRLVSQTSPDFLAILNALETESRALNYRRNRIGNYLNALKEAYLEMLRSSPGEKQFQDSEHDPTRISIDRLISHMRFRIFKAWNDRARGFAKIVARLECYAETDFKHRPDGTIDIQSKHCASSRQCAAAALIKSKDRLTESLYSIVEKDKKGEFQRYKKILSKILNGNEISKSDCQALGDLAIVASSIHEADSIVTTNEEDFVKLTEDLGIKIVCP